MLIAVLLAHTFEFRGDQFVLDGENFQIKSGEMVLPRISRDLWEHHILAAKAMGLNTLTLTLPWNAYEDHNASFHFTAPRADIKAFIRMCIANDMYVIIRPGPYVGSEVDFGGIPAFFLEKDNMEFRSSQTEFFDVAWRWLDALEYHLREVREAILMVQLDNMYSMHSPRDLAYLPKLIEFWTENGYKHLFISEPYDHLNETLFPAGVALGIIGKPGSNEFNKAKSMFPNVPVFASDVYTGFPLDAYDGVQVCSNNMRSQLDWYSGNGYSFSLHMFAGGSNFGTMAGSGSLPNFTPRASTYDFTAPISESGRISNYYREYRDTLQNYYDSPLIDIPADPKVATFGEIKMNRIAGIFEQDFIVSANEKPQHYESFLQNQGIIVYQTTLPVGIPGKLAFEHISDYAHFYLNGRHIYTYNRSSSNTTIQLDTVQYPGELEILVDAYGHADTGYLYDHKGIYGEVTFDGVKLTGWTMKRLPLNSKIVARDVQNARLGGVFIGYFQADATAGTYFDMSAYKKAALYVNGELVGRYFENQLQSRLYCASEFLINGVNTIAVLDIEESVGGSVISYDSAKQIGCI